MVFRKIGAGVVQYVNEGRGYGEMRIQERGREILRRCYEQQFLLMDHVERFFFASVAAQNARLRIKQMEQAGLLKMIVPKKIGERKIVRLTRAGVAIAKQFHPFEIPQARRIDFDTFDHDAIVTSVALRLQELWDGVWVPERALKMEDYAQVPDGVFVFDSGNKVAIEVENSLKGRTRFLTILDRWRHVPLRLILYVTTDPRIHKSLKEYIANGPGGVPFGLVEWSGLRDGKPTAWCPKGELDIFKRRSF